MRSSTEQACIWTRRIDTAIVRSTYVCTRTTADARLGCLLLKEDRQIRQISVCR
jgi:hypothetical protein